MFHLQQPDKRRNRFDLDAGARNTVGSSFDSSVIGLGLETRYATYFLFLLPLIQEEQLSVTGESMGTQYWLTA